MSDYTKTTNFAAKDSLPSGNSGKIVKGSEIDTEFTNIQTAVATKLNINNSALTGTTTAQTLDISGNVDVDGTLETDALSLNGVTVTSTAAELNILDGVTSTTAELNYVDGVTSNVQTQLNTKAPLASPTFTGTVTAAGLTVDTTTLVVDASNNRVGIGTSSPSTKLHLGGSAPGDSIIRQDSTASGTNWEIGERSAGKWQIFEDDTDSIVATFMSSGNVAIGTTSAGSGLHVNRGTSGAPATSGTTQNGTLRLSSAATTGILDFGMNGANPWIQATDSGGLNNNYHIALNPNGGNVGVGTAAPGHKFDVNGGNVAVDAGYGLVWSGATARIVTPEDNSVGGLFAVGASAATRFMRDTTESMRIDASGNLLVGTTSSGFSAKFIVQNTASYTIHSKRTGTGSEGHVVFQNGNGAVGSIFTNGTATAYNQSSDRRLKENIADADDAGSKVDAIQVRKFDWKVDGSHQDYGMIAQELQTVAPEAVTGDADSDEMMGVDYSKLVPMLVKEIQALRNRVAQLENS
jgi:hypothetical protein